MRASGIIEHSQFPHSSPLIVIKKRDNCHRICLDFRKLNNLTVFDSEPMCDSEAIFSKVAGCKYFSKIDLSKRYCQVSLKEQSKQYSAFQTDHGLHQFTVLLFGLVEE